MFEERPIKDLLDISKDFLQEYEQRTFFELCNEDEGSWNVSLFIANLLLNSTPTISFTVENLQNDINEFNLSKGTSISLEKLIDNAYIRIIFDEIEIPGTLWWFCKDFAKNSAEQEKFKDKDNFYELLFIGTLYNKYLYEDSRPFEIKKRVLEKLILNHRTLFPKMPQDAELLEKLCFTENGEVYLFTPFRFQSSCSDLVNVYIWEKLPSDNDYDRLKKWLCLTEFLTHTNDCLKLFSSNSRKQFSNAAFELLKNENDIKITSVNLENRKIVLDVHEIRHINEECYFNPQKIYNKIVSDYTDLLDLWVKKEFSSNYYDSVIYTIVQESRGKITNLIRLLLFTNNTHEFYSNASNLLEISKDRPFIFFMVLFFLKKNAPEKLLYFFNNKDYGLIFYFNYIDCCIEKLINRETKTKETILELINNSTDVFFKNFNNDNIRTREISLFLMFFIKMRFTFDRRADVLKKKKEIYGQITKKIKPIFQSILTNSKNYEEIINTFDTYKEKPYDYDNYGFSIKNLAFYFQILQLSDNNETVKNNITEMITPLLINFLQFDKLVFAYDFYEMEDFQWDVYFEDIVKNNKFKTLSEIFEQLLKQNENIKIDDDYETRKTLAIKLRIHMFFLVKAYEKSRTSYVDKSIIKTLEQTISSYTIKMFANRNFCIFDNLYELSRIDNNNQELLPLILDIFNLFSSENKQNIINSILEFENFSNIFTVYNNLEDEDSKELIREYIKNKDFSNQLNNIYTIPDFIHVLINVINSHIDDNLAQKMLDELEKIIKNKIEKKIISDFTFGFYNLKLFDFYRKNDIDSLKALSIPSEIGTMHKETVKKFENRKIFYIALLNIDKNLDFSKESFLKIVKSEPDNIEFLVWYIRTRYLIAKQTSDYGEYKKILSELDSILSNRKNLEDIDWHEIEIAFITKLNLLHELDKSQEIVFFHTLPEELKRNVYYAEDVIMDLIKDDKSSEANEIFSNISIAYKETKEYEKLEKLINSDEKVVELSNAYLKILGMSDYKRFKVIPETILSFTNNVGDFILSELIVSLNITLKKQDLVKKLSGMQEDSITDLIQIGLHSSLNMFKYKVSSQDRSGSSETGINAGELDLSIDLTNSSIVIEAVRYSGGSLDNIEKHILKNFDYDPSKTFLFNLVYYQGDKEKFNDVFTSLEDLVKKIDYPSSYEYRDFEIIDSAEINNNGIKILKVYHNNNLVFYHVLVDFSYAEKATNSQGEKK